VVAHWTKAFEASRGVKYRFMGARDGKSIKSLLATFEDDAEAVCKVIDNAFADGFWGNKITLGKLASDPNQFTSRGPATKTKIQPPTGIIFKTADIDEIMAKIGPGEGWEIWQHIYSTSRRNYGRYIRSAGDDRAMSELVDAANREAAAELGDEEGDLHQLAEELVKHWAIEYIRDDGTNDYYSDRRHPLGLLPKRLTEYGLPKRWGVVPEPQIPDPPPDPPGTVYCGPTPEFLEAAKAFGVEFGKL
jgi:hypothetical protein